MVTPRPATAQSPEPNEAVDGQAPVSLAAVKSLLAGLNREQRRAVTHREGPQLVIAGPGTGKTEVVTRRVAWLIATKRARPREILALTFTDAAAQEMQARVDTLVPYGQADAAIHTFHALGDRLVREHAFELGLPGDVRLVSRGEQIVLLREHLFELGLQRYLPLGDPTRFLAALVELFMRAKDEAVTPDAFREHADSLAALAREDAADAAVLADLATARTELANAFAAYQRLLAQRGLIDHGDQIGLALRLLRERPAVRAAIAAQYRYLLVDEFQDTNPCQLELVFALTGEQRNVTLVGDPDQAIYTFRGAATSNTRRFVAAHPDLRWVTLRRNYRSRAPILQAAGRLIGHSRSAGDLATTSLGWPLAQRRGRAPAPVRRLCFPTPEGEANGVAAAIAERIDAGARPSDFAVLVRTNGEARTFARSLAVHGVPAASSAPRALLDQPHVRTMLAYLRVVADPAASMELYMLSAEQPYAVSGEALAGLLADARRRHAPLWDVLVAATDGTARLAPADREAVRRVVADVRAGLAMAPLRTSGELLYDFLRRSGVLDRLAAIEPRGDSAELRAVARFFELCRARARLLAEDRVASLVPHLVAIAEAAPDDEGGDVERPDAVSVLTAHRAKGLEFRYVYLCGLVEGRFPARGRPPLLALPAELLSHRASLAEEDPLAEERRLAYVAMTRARDELWLCHHTFGPDRRGARRPSQFIAEALDAAAQPVQQAPDLLAALQPAPHVHPTSNAPRASGHDAALSLSYSQLDDYLSCPERYRLRYVVGVPTPAHHALAYGSAMHSAVAAFHLRRAQGQAMTEDELLDAFAAAWAPAGYLSREHEEARYAHGRQALLRFRRRALSEPATTVAIEKPFSFRVGRDLVRGRIDRVDADPAGTVIVDYKSSDVPEQDKADKRARDSLQLQIYALAHQAETGQLPRELRLHFLDSDTVGKTVADDSRLAKAREQIVAAADGIRAGDFEARPNPVACGYCPFREICQRSAVRAAA